MVVVDGGTPEHIRDEVKALQAERPFKLISFPYMVKPCEARNIGVAETSTEYVVLSDNDIAYEPGWLEALEKHAREHDSDAIAPLICIGPPAATTIHHAGGRLHLVMQDGKRTLIEKHRLMNMPMDQVTPTFPEVANHVCEFHCLMAKRSLLDKMGGLDERLITREQMDFAVRTLVLGGRTTFCRESVMTYMAKEDFNESDLEYHLFRWSDQFVVESMDAFEETWPVALERHRIRYSWTAGHRIRACGTVFPWKRRLLGKLMFRSSVVEPLEREVMDKQLALRAHLKPSIPKPLSAERIATVLDALAIQETQGFYEAAE